ncbi:MAG: putative isochorismatase hydrolase [Clostridium sp.]|nr:putative isochorismatase hydrolase [Clostridium sp.]
MVKILNACRENNVPIIHVIRIYKEDASNVDISRKQLIESGINIVNPNSVGADLVKLIKPENSEELKYEKLLEGNIQSISNKEWVIYKSRWGAFYKTNLEDFLKSMDIDTLIFIGCNFPNCPRTSIYEASERDFKVVAVEDAISGTYNKGLEEIKNIGVHVYNTNQLVDKICTTYEK